MAVFRTINRGCVGFDDVLSMVGIGSMWKVGASRALRRNHGFPGGVEAISEIPFTILPG